MAQRVTIPRASFAVELSDFAARIIYVRCVLLRMNRIQLGKVIGHPHASIANWEKGRIPHDQVAVAKAYVQVAKAIEPRITAGWLLDGESNLPLYAGIRARESRSTNEQLLATVA